MLSISFRKYHNAKKKKKLVYFNHQNVNSLCLHHHYIIQQFALVLRFYRVLYNSPSYSRILIGSLPRSAVGQIHD